LTPWARLWHLWVSSAFLRAYRETTAACGLVPQEPEELGSLLRFYVQKHIIKELAYDLDPPLPRVEVPLLGVWYLLENPRIKA